MIPDAESRTRAQLRRYQERRYRAATPPAREIAMRATACRTRQRQQP
jgi:hypothetical protein